VVNADKARIVLIVIRLIVYRRNVVSMLKNHNTNKSGFLRLYLLCAICIMGIFPLEIYIDYRAISAGLLPFDWAQTHNPTQYDWNSTFLIPSGGVILFDRYIWLAGGLLIFLTFGFGREASKMYREMLVKVGLARFFPALLQTGQSTTLTTDGSGGRWMSSMTSSVSSKVRFIFPGKSRDNTSDRSACSDHSTNTSQGSPREKSTFDVGVEKVC
jgi:pheromone a factor receptor